MLYESHSQFAQTLIEGISGTHKSEILDDGLSDNKEIEERLEEILALTTEKQDENKDAATKKREEAEDKLE